MTPSSRTVRQRKRDALIEPIADYLLRHGLEASNLRALALAAGTSDRMLLYYFADKDDLVRCALDRLGARLEGALNALPFESGYRPEKLIEEVWSALCEPHLWPYVVLFLEMAVRAGREGDPYLTAALAVTTRLQHWVGTRLVVDDAAADDAKKRHSQAMRIVATIDGFALLRHAGLPMD